MANSLKKRKFANTGKDVSVLGLGTVKFGRNLGVKYPQGFELPSDKKIEEILDICLEYGLNLLDTAPAYGYSEKRLGELMGSRRDKFFLASKTGEEFDGKNSEYIFTKEHTEESITRSLKRLKTDYLDCVLVHCSHDDLHILADTPVLEVLESFKQKGDILSYGASIYTALGGKYAADYTDAVMIEYNLGYKETRPLLDYTAELGKAVLIKKGLSSGHSDSPADAIKHITSIPAVTSMIFGSITPENIVSNIKIA